MGGRFSEGAGEEEANRTGASVRTMTRTGPGSDYSPVNHGFSSRRPLSKQTLVQIKHGGRLLGSALGGGACRCCARVDDHRSPGFSITGII